MPKGKVVLKIKTIISIMILKSRTSRRRRRGEREEGRDDNT